jgi:hypothetical protein
LPFGVPSKEQQLEALSAEKGILPLSENEIKKVAKKIREKMKV